MAAEGPGNVLTQLYSVETEEVDLSEIRQSTVIEKRLLSPAPLVKLLRDEPVRIRLIIAGR